MLIDGGLPPLMPSVGVSSLSLGHVSAWPFFYHFRYDLKTQPNIEFPAFGLFL